MGETSITATIPNILAAIGTLKYIFPPVGRVIDNATNIFWPNNFPDPSSLIEGVNKGVYSQEYYELCMGFQGYGADTARNMQKLGRKYLDAYDAIVLYRKGRLTESQFLGYMERNGIATHDIMPMIQSVEWMPSAQDLIRFAVREVYSDEIAKTYGLFEDMPEKYLEEADKIGMPREVARLPWAAHWDLPSAGQGYEMFHRGIISRDELNTLLRALDYMPFWRDKMIDMSYNLVTRVDARRFYGLGVWDEQRLAREYAAMGYRPEDVADMVTFTKRYENTEADGLTRDNLISSYVKGIIDRETLEALLVKLNYSDLVVSYYMTVADVQMAQAEIDLITDDLVSQYLQGQITQDTIRIALTEQDLPASYVETVMRRVVQRQAEKRKVPERSTLEEWYKLGIIDDAYYYGRMRMIGYVEEDIYRYLSAMILEKGTIKRRYLKPEIYQKWVREKMMSPEQFADTLHQANYSDDDIAVLLMEATDGEN